MDLMTMQANRPVLDRLQGLADERGEDDVLGLAITEIRGYQASLHSHRQAIQELLAAQGVTDWVADPGSPGIARFPVSL